MTEHEPEYESRAPGTPRAAPDNPRLIDSVLQRHALQFIWAADLYAQADGHREWMPSYFLLGRGVELTLKAYLIRCGTPESELRTIGHNLHAMLVSAVAKGLAPSAPLTDTDRQAIALINKWYQTKLLEYPQMSLYTFPNPTVMRTAVSKVVHAVHLAIWGEEFYRRDVLRSVPGLVHAADIWDPKA